MEVARAEGLGGAEQVEHEGLELGFGEGLDLGEIDFVLALRAGAGEGRGVGAGGREVLRLGGEAGHQLDVGDVGAVDDRLGERHCVGVGGGGGKELGGQLDVDHVFLHAERGQPGDFFIHTG